MVIFRPFKGYLPNLSEGEDICDRISPPYDVIDDNKKRDLLNKPFNIARITLGDNGDNYDSAKRELESWLKEGRLILDLQESFYLYRQSFKYNGRELSRTGIVGLLKVEDYEKANILPHEETIAKVKDDRLNLLRATEFHLESIFGVIDHLDNGIIERTISTAKVLWECEDEDGVQHSFRRISDQQTIQIISECLDQKKILIADGHHRYETALRYSRERGDEKSQFVLATIVSSDDPGMIVFPTHRIIYGTGLRNYEIVEILRRNFDIMPVKDFHELKKHVFASDASRIGIITSDHECAIITPKMKRSDTTLWDIDAFVFQELGFNSLLERAKSKDKISIEYEHDANEVFRKITSNGYDLAVILKPPTLDQIWKVAEQGLRMPKKTTYFWPKIWSGFVAYSMKK
ncbi:MAG: DUF1015 domain-containing protein [Methanomassiliicoccales archaeon]|jgi:uncharacterized protein (DUF1015 family)|nr:DUF1015 domain-containing protein [Methanomassiliicoccales archaeon]